MQNNNQRFDLDETRNVLLETADFFSHFSLRLQNIGIITASMSAAAACLLISIQTAPYIYNMDSTDPQEMKAVKTSIFMHSMAALTGMSLFMAVQHGINAAYLICSNLRSDNFKRNMAIIHTANAALSVAAMCFYPTVTGNNVAELFGRHLIEHATFNAAVSNAALSIYKLYDVMTSSSNEQTQAPHQH